MKYQRLFLLLMISTFAIGACKKDETSDKPKDPDTKVTISLITKGITNISNTSAESGVTIQVTGAGNIDEVGICWSINNSPTINDAKVSGSETSTSYNNTSKNFDLNILSIDSNTTYFVRAYAVYKDSVYYGNELTFKTPTSTNSESQFWILEGKINTDTLVVINAPDDKAVIFTDGKGGIGVVKFNNGIQAPFEYSVVSIADTLLVSGASLLMNNSGEIWNSNGDESKIKTSIVNGKYKVEFLDVEMKNVTDSARAKSSATFYVEP
jgi:hypothetical protein